MSKFNVGDLVFVKNMPSAGPSNQYPGVNPEMVNIVRKKGQIPFKIKSQFDIVTYYLEGTGGWLWHEKWFVLAEKAVVKTKEEELLDKIAYLWNKQEYVKCLNSR